MDRFFKTGMLVTALLLPHAASAAAKLSCVKILTEGTLIFAGLCVGNACLPEFRPLPEIHFVSEDRPFSALKEELEAALVSSTDSEDRTLLATKFILLNPKTERVAVTQEAPRTFWQKLTFQARPRVPLLVEEGKFAHLVVLRIFENEKGEIGSEWQLADQNKEGKFDLRSARVYEHSSVESLLDSDSAPTNPLEILFEHPSFKKKLQRWETNQIEETQSEAYVVDETSSGKTVFAWVAGSRKHDDGSEINSSKIFALVTYPKEGKVRITYVSIGEPLNSGI